MSTSSETGASVRSVVQDFGQLIIRVLMLSQGSIEHAMQLGGRVRLAQRRSELYTANANEVLNTMQTGNQALVPLGARDINK